MLQLGALCPTWQTRYSRSTDTPFRGKIRRGGITVSWLPAPHFWLAGSAFFTIGSFALFAILGFAGISRVSAAYRRWLVFGYIGAFVLFGLGWWQAAH